MQNIKRLRSFDLNICRQKSFHIENDLSFLLFNDCDISLQLVITFPANNRCMERKAKIYQD